MTRLLKKWFGNTGVEVVILAMISTSTAYAQAASSSTSLSSSPTGTFKYFGQQYVDSGLGSAIDKQYGSSGALSTNVVSPLLDGTLMTTMGGQSFNAQMWCPSSRSFLSVTIVPSGTGDIQEIVVTEDTNFDGRYDYTFSLPPGVRGSGVCGNGIISCDAGTWSNCSYWEWIADSSGKVGLQAVPRESLGGCFCVNNYCGSNIILKETQLVLTSLGGGVVGAVQATNPKYAVSNSSITDTTINYFAQNTGSCGQLSSSDPSVYYNSPAAMDQAASGAASMQMQDPNSIYYTVMNSEAATENKGQFMTCSVKKTPVVNTLSANPTYAWLPWLHIYDVCEWGRDSVNGCWVTVDVDRNSDGAYDAPQDSYSWGCCWAWYEDINTVGRPLAKDVVSKSQQKYGVSATDVLENTSSEQWWRIDGGGKGMDGDYTFYVIDYSKKSPPICPAGYTWSNVYGLCYQESASIDTADACTRFASNAGCKLKDETVDTVVTFRDFQTTGLVPLSSCKTVTGKLQSYIECSPWWEKDRTYFCQGQAFDFSEIKQRTANIDKTITNDSLNINYQDLTRDQNGSSITANYSFQAPMANGTTDTCQQACQTRKPILNTAASTTTTRAATAETTDSTLTLFKRCAEDGTCPVDASQGEIVVKECQCMNQFLQSAAIINALADAGGSMVCSDGLTNDSSQ
jgi:hypothetical protein